MPSYNVPFFSQYSDLGEHEWRARGCGIASLKMVMDFWHGVDGANKTEQLDELLRRGLSSGAYLEGIGWRHRGLSLLAAEYGYESFNKDLAAGGPEPKSKEEAWESLLSELRAGPILVSVWRHMEPSPSGGHIITVTGFEDELVFFNDPIELSEAEGRKALALRSFLPLFKQRFIVLRPKK